MTASEFYAATPREFWNRLHGWQERELRREQLQWEQTRFIAFYCVYPHTDTKKSNLKFTDIAQFPWQKKARTKPLLSREEILRKTMGRGAKLSEKLKREIDVST